MKILLYQGLLILFSFPSCPTAQLENYKCHNSIDYGFDGSIDRSASISVKYDQNNNPFQVAIKHDIKIGKNKTLVIDGNNCGYLLSLNCSYFNNLTLNQSSTLIIRNLSQIRFAKITTKKNAQIIFEQSTDVYVKNYIKLKDDNYVGPDPAMIDEITLNFFVEDQLEVDKSRAFVANSIAGDIHIKDADIDQRKTMTGNLISKDKIDSDTNITWESNTEGGISSEGIMKIPQFSVVVNESNRSTDTEAINFDIYTNPVSKNAQIQLNTFVKEGHITIFHNSGILLRTLKITETNKLNIPLAGINNGIYFIEVETADAKLTKTLIINN